MNTNLAEAVSTRQSASLLCQQALAGAPTAARRLLVRMDGPVGFVVLAAGDQPIALWQLRPGPDLRACLTQARLDRLRGSIDSIVTLGGRSGRALAEALAEYLGPLR